MNLTRPFYTNIECGTARDEGGLNICLTNNQRHIAGLSVRNDFGRDSSPDDEQGFLAEEDVQVVSDLKTNSYGYQDEDNVMHEILAESEHVPAFLRLETDKEKIDFLLKFADTRIPMGKLASG
ncbi:hypothetical protein MN608_11088 [Microdochium nivale]|nr:hypothetical protein MN608_11088 [Microdochium nivale]